MTLTAGVGVTLTTAAFTVPPTGNVVPAGVLRIAEGYLGLPVFANQEFLHQLVADEASVTRLQVLTKPGQQHDERAPAGSPRDRRGRHKPDIVTVARVAAARIAEPDNEAHRRPQYPSAYAAGVGVSSAGATAAAA